ncbi:uncharacterized protein PHACADRAFT_189347 [Phanerochaete carnosa HHB-10118-sp]|uniref:Uncharacterized protein n=1 Tax=Phanerochaete carnosa (strain HHB-10118-sp) TaxID=650164 RepID=K5XB86_PHACS|nr:uncharacterized protein PHACADRAFT_189347 [Phanerochaete carnosa HHB-10118-sp]EKM60212.1 hypothetical protein PHACADRAFT_189347 [Phanerochaete carnosa HHB-10118-sp]
MPTQDSPPVYFEPSEPPTIPVLISQTEVIPQHSSVNLVSMIVLTPTETTDCLKLSVQATTPHLRDDTLKTARLTPYEKPAPKKVFIQAASASPASQVSAESSLTSIASTVNAEDSAPALIPKPSGEAGRPGRGEYNFEDKLRKYGWSDATLEKFKVEAGQQVEQHLNIKKSFTFQSLPALDTICEHLVAKFPDLGAYENTWPVEDAIRAKLKYTLHCARQKKA